MPDVIPPPQEDSSSSTSSTEGFMAAQVGALASADDAHAADALRAGFQLMLKQLGNRQTPVEQLQGNFFEYIEAAKFNADAARKGSDLVAQVTDAIPGRGTDKVDIEIMQGRQVIKAVQAKSSGNHVWVTQKLSTDGHYQGQSKLTNPENAEAVRKLAQKASQSLGNNADGYKDTTKKVAGELNAKGIRSGGTPHAEAVKAAENRQAYVAQQNLKALGREAAVSAVSAATAATIIGGSISLIKNGLAVKQGDLTVQQATARITQDVGKAGVKGATVGALSAGIRSGASAFKIPVLSQGNVAAALAAGLIDVGVNVYSYSKGEITSEVLTQRMANTGVSTLSGLYYGAAAEAVFGVFGGAIGGMGAYMVASYIYQVCRELDKRAQLAEQEADRVAALAGEAFRQMQMQRAELELLLENKLQTRHDELQSCLTAIDEGLTADDPQSTTLALSDFAQLFGRQLQYATFEEFDAFMQDEDKSLKL